MSEAAGDQGDCLFCKFVSGEIKPDVVHETGTTLAFRDIEPQAPTPRPGHPEGAPAELRRFSPSTSPASRSTS